MTTALRCLGRGDLRKRSGALLAPGAEGGGDSADAQSGRGQQALEDGRRVK